MLYPRQQFLWTLHLSSAVGMRSCKNLSPWKLQRNALVGVFTFNLPTSTCPADNWEEIKPTAKCCKRIQFTWVLISWPSAVWYGEVAGLILAGQGGGRGGRAGRTSACATISDACCFFAVVPAEVAVVPAEVRVVRAEVRVVPADACTPFGITWDGISLSLLLVSGSGPHSGEWLVWRGSLLSLKKYSRLCNRVDRQSPTCGEKNNTTHFISLMGTQDDCSIFFAQTLCLPLPRRRRFVAIPLPSPTNDICHIYAPLSQICHIDAILSQKWHIYGILPAFPLLKCPYNAQCFAKEFLYYARIFVKMSP